MKQIKYAEQTFLQKMKKFGKTVRWSVYVTFQNNNTVNREQDLVSNQIYFKS